VFSPLPSFKSTLATQMINSSHQVSREHCAKCTTGMKDTRPLSKFIPSIPGANHILHSGIESAFCQPNEESQNIDLSSCVTARKTHCQDCPYHLSFSVSENHLLLSGNITSHAGIHIEGRTRVKRILLGISPIT
jgi:hypothetical protein